MKTKGFASIVVALAAGCAAGLAGAQQKPAFAGSDLTPAGVRAMAANCAGCHGTDGHAVRVTDDLTLAGMPKGRFVARMVSFRDSKSSSATVMHQLAKGFTDAEIAALADHYAAMKRGTGGFR